MKLAVCLALLGLTAATTAAKPPPATKAPAAKNNIAWSKPIWGSSDVGVSAPLKDGVVVNAGIYDMAAFNVMSGATEWSMGGFYSSQPTMFKEMPNVAAIAGIAGVALVNLTAKKTIWTGATHLSCAASRFSLSTSANAIVGTGTKVFNDTALFEFAVDAGTGKLLWERAVPTPGAGGAFSPFRPPALSDDGSLYFTIHGLDADSLKYRVSASSVSTGVAQWSVEERMISMNVPTVCSDTVTYVNEGGLIARDQKTGKPLWNQYNGKCRGYLAFVAQGSVIGCESRSLRFADYVDSPAPTGNSSNAFYVVDGENVFRRYDRKGCIVGTSNLTAIDPAFGNVQLGATAYSAYAAFVLATNYTTGAVVTAAIDIQHSAVTYTGLSHIAHNSTINIEQAVAKITPGTYRSIFSTGGSLVAVDMII